MNTKLLLHLDEELKKALVKEAKKNKTSMSAIVRLMIINWLDKSK
jgi:predicted HicB family RNase H-like nuclease